MTKSLPQAGRQTTAATTGFVHARIDGPGGLHLFIDGNQKISGWDPKPNAFSLPQIESCPGSTPTCRSGCYVHALEKHQPDLHALYRHNFETIKEILVWRGGHNAWAVVLGSWISEHCADVGFRWHVSGDLFSKAYAEFIYNVWYQSNNINHWIYTRSFYDADQLPMGMSVNLSADKDNYPAARARLNQGVGHRICYYTDDGHVPADLPDGSVIFPDYSLRGNTEWRDSLPEHQRKMLCPVDMYGKSEKHRCGPCKKCIDP